MASWEIILIWLFWLSIGLVVYSYVGYPLFILLLSRLFGQQPVPGEPQKEWPRVSLLIAAYNEEVYLTRRIENALALDYPRDRLDIVINDGARYVQETTAQFDIIFVDGFDRHARVGALDTSVFYQACRARLSDQGLIAVNLFGRTRRFDASINRIAQIFNDRIVVLPPSEGGNVIAFGVLGDAVELRGRELKAQVRKLRAASGLNLSHVVRGLEETDSV